MNQPSDQPQPGEKNYADIENTLYPPKFVAECLGVMTRRLKGIVEENNIEIQRVPRGTVAARAYTLKDIFDLAALRREKGVTKGLARQIVVSTFVQKGGTAKTTTAVNFAVYLQLCGLRVLLVDNDPQGDSSCMLGFDPDLMPNELAELGIPADRFVDGNLGNLITPLLRMSPFNTKTLSEVIRLPFGPNGPHLIPAENHLDDLGIALDASNNSDWWYSEWIKAASSGQLPGCDTSHYDVIIFDNPPSANRLTKNSIAASDLLLCPIRLDRFSFRALTRLHDWLVRFSSDYKWHPSVAVMPTMFIKNRNRLLANLLLLNQMFPGKVTEGKILYSEDYAKAMDQGFPLMLWKHANSKTLECAREVYGEILEHMRDLAQR